jgi:hypothetical protein
MEHNQVLQLLMFSLVLDLEFVKSVIILFSELKFSVNLVGQLLSDISEQLSQIFVLSLVGGHCVLELGS